MRTFKRNITMALTTIRSSRGRSFLTVLGVVIAVASVTVIASIGRGIQASIAKQTNQYNKDVITVQPAAIKTGGTAVFGSAPQAAFTANDINNIDKISSVSTVVPLSVVGSSAKADRQFNGAIFSASSDLPQVLNQQLAFGAFYTAKETSANLAVLGADAAKQLFDQSVPLGRTFTIKGQQYIVNGVLEPFATAPLTGGNNFNDAIFIADNNGSQPVTNVSAVYQVLVKVGNDSQLASTDRSITVLLAKAHGSDNAFNVLSPTELASQTTAGFGLLAGFVVIAAAITLLVSGIGIMNVMLVSVAERMHEIGIRKAVGATNRQILGQFVTEAATLSVVGSVIGALVALAVVYVLRMFSSLAPTYDWRIAGLAVITACVFGIIFGTVPAIKAARKDPIAALRSQ